MTPQVIDSWRGLTLALSNGPSRGVSGGLGVGVAAFSLGASPEGKTCSGPFELCQYIGMPVSKLVAVTQPADRGGGEPTGVAGNGSIQPALPVTESRMKVCPSALGAWSIPCAYPGVGLGVGRVDGLDTDSFSLGSGLVGRAGEIVLDMGLGARSRLDIAKIYFGLV